MNYCEIFFTLENIKLNFNFQIDKKINDLNFKNELRIQMRNEWLKYFKIHLKPKEN